MKTHWRLKCVLCMKERLKFYKDGKKQEKLINDKHKMFGPCQCKTRFHSVFRTAVSNEDGHGPERVREIKTLPDFLDDDEKSVKSLHPEHGAENFEVAQIQPLKLKRILMNP